MKSAINLRHAVIRYVFAIVLACPCRPTSAQQIIVTTSQDRTDIPAAAMISDLPGPDGVISLREALRVSDNESGHQTIGFEIPENDWYLSDIFPGLVLIQGSFNWSAFDSVTIDGASQTAFTGDTNPNGHEIVLYGLDLVVNGDHSHITGLDSSHVTLYGSHGCLVCGNTGDMSIEASTGSFHLIVDNEADTIELSYSNYNLIVGNTARRVRVSGGGPLFGPAKGNQIGGPSIKDRNFITGWGNYGEHGFPAGTTLDLYGTQNTLIQNNYIGTTPDGMAIGNRASTAGIGIITDNRQIAIRDNLIAIAATHANGAGSFGAPIYIDGYEGASEIQILGNTMGLNADGEPVLGGLHGIWINDSIAEYADRITIGGQQPRQGNVIAGHTSTGVLLEGAPGIVPVGGIRLSGNLIFDNGEIGIDLMPNTWDFGPTENDPHDSDIGANGLQNYPVLLAAWYRSGTTEVEGELNSGALNSYTIEFFASPNCDSSGFGQAEWYLGSVAASTDTSGHASFGARFVQELPAGWVLTSTATDESTGATSEFSACINVSGPPDQIGDVNQDGAINLQDVEPFVQWLVSNEYFNLADINQDGTLDLWDIEPFAQLLNSN